VCWFLGLWHSSGYVGLANLGSESETCVGSRVHLVGVSISFEKNFYRLPFTPPSLVRRIGHSLTNGRVSVLALVLGSLWALGSPHSVSLHSSQRTNSPRHF
jgi:hypothetical protein